jgi:hypothetical protein
LVADYVKASKCSHSLTKADIGASPCHIRGAALSGLRNNGGLRFVIARV